MILGFKQTIKDKPTFFVDKIIACFMQKKKAVWPKLHTIRADEKDRWRRGRLIHFCTGVRTKAFHNFLKAPCRATQKIKISHSPYKVEVAQYGSNEFKPLNERQIYLLARNDGFDTVREFWEWFDKPFEGKIIHWTELIY